MYLVTAGEMREMDRQTIESCGIPGQKLMENAGRGATCILLNQFPDRIKKGVGIVAGRGNNGGDGFVIARYLAQKGINVTVYLLAKATAVKGDAAANLQLLPPLNIPLIELPDENSFLKHKSDIAKHDLLVDAILGTGLKSEVKGYFEAVINYINSLKTPVFAVDIPSGLNSDNGQPCGVSIRAQATATFAFAKTGHLLFPGADYTGALDIVDIGIPDHIAEKVDPKQYLLTSDLIRTYFQPRFRDTHKGRTGHLLVIAGSPGKTGAAAMTAMSAMRAGAGLVTLGIPQSLNPILECQVLEAMTAPLPEIKNGILGKSAFDTIMDLISGKKCVAIGPGLGQADETKSLVIQIIDHNNIPMVIDADGLNNLAGQTQILQDRKFPVILTPHPGEMARLSDATVGFVQQNRIECSRSFATKFNAHLVLKGAGTVIAHPDGRVYLNPTGNPGMASGGMGDVLTGVIAGLITQGFPPEAATHAAVYMHGAAADILAKSIAPFGYLAGDVMNAIPGEIKKLMNGQ